MTRPTLARFRRPTLLGEWARAGGAPAPAISHESNRLWASLTQRAEQRKSRRRGRFAAWYLSLAEDQRIASEAASLVVCLIVIAIAAALVAWLA